MSIKDSSVIRNRVLAILASASAAVAVMSPLNAGAQGGPSAGQVSRSLERLKHVTGAYHNEALAIAGRFERENMCVSSPEGAMGYHYHYANGERFDLDVNRDQPEALLYAPGPDGTRVLTGVEYFKVDADQDVATDDDRPTLFGRPFDGPMPGHGPGMPVHYDLHVWLWRWNPNGMFAQWNPRVTCPE